MRNESGKSWIIPVFIIVAIIAAGFLFYFYTLKPPEGLANDASGNTRGKQEPIKWYPYEEGLARYEMGRHLPPGDPARQEHLSCAREIFTRLETSYDLSLTMEELHD